jgi:hypothetical protein
MAGVGREATFARQGIANQRQPSKWRRAATVGGEVIAGIG